MTRLEIIAIVRAKLDEINPLAEGTTILDPQIDAQLDSAAVRLVESLPSVLAHPYVHPSPSSIVPQNLVAEISIDLPCPTDFIRLHRLKLSHWYIGISDLLPANHPRVEIQQYKHVRATNRRPFGVLRSGGTYIITCYPPFGETIAANEVTEFIYVQKPANAEALNNDLVDLLAWQAASIIYTVHGQGQNAELCRTNLMQAMETKLKYIS